MLFFTSVVGRHNSMEFFSEDDFKGDSMDLSEPNSDLTFENITVNGVKSLVVTGPDSWEVFPEAGYVGQRVTLEPGKYSEDQVLQLVQFKIASAKRKSLNYACDIHLNSNDGIARVLIEI